MNEKGVVIETRYKNDCLSVFGVDWLGLQLLGQQLERAHLVNALCGIDQELINVFVRVERAS